MRCASKGDEEVQVTMEDQHLQLNDDNHDDDDNYNHDDHDGMVIVLMIYI